MARDQKIMASIAETKIIQFDTRATLLTFPLPNRITINEQTMAMISHT